MTPKEEKRKYRTRKLVYLLLVILIEILIYALLYVIFSLMNYLYELHPYIRLTVLILLFPISYYISNILLHSKLIDEIVNNI